MVEPRPTYALDDFEAKAPAMMSDLMHCFLVQTDLNARTKIRARMLAVLDFFGVDTIHPPIPALNPADASRRDVADAPLPVPQIPAAAHAAPPQAEQPGDVHLVPGA